MARSASIVIALYNVNSNSLFIFKRNNMEYSSFLQHKSLGGHWCVSTAAARIIFQLLMSGPDHGLVRIAAVTARYPIQTLLLFTMATFSAVSILASQCTESEFWNTHIIPRRPAILLSPLKTTHLLGWTKVRLHQVVWDVSKLSQSDKDIALDDHVQDWMNAVQTSWVVGPPLSPYFTGYGLPLEFNWKDLCLKQDNASSQCIPVSVVATLSNDSIIPITFDSSSSILKNIGDESIKTFTWIWTLNVTDSYFAETAWIWARYILTIPPSHHTSLVKPFARNNFAWFEMRTDLNTSHLHPIPSTHLNTDDHSESRLKRFIMMLNRLIAHATLVIERADPWEAWVVISAYILAFITILGVYFWLRRCGSQFTLFIMTLLCAISAFVFSLLTVSALGVLAHPHLILEAMPFLVISAGLRTSTRVIRAVMTCTGERIRNGSIKMTDDIISSLLNDLHQVSSSVFRTYSIRFGLLAIVYISGIHGLANVAIMAGFALFYHYLLLFSVFPAILMLKLMVMRIRVSKSTELNHFQGIKRVRKHNQSIQRQWWNALFVWIDDSFQRITTSFLTLLSNHSVVANHVSLTIPSDECTNQASVWEEDVFDPSVARLKLLLGILFVATQVMSMTASYHRAHAIPVNSQIGFEVELQSDLLIMDYLSKLNDKDGPLCVEIPTPIVFSSNFHKWLLFPFFMLILRSYSQEWLKLTAANMRDFLVSEMVSIRIFFEGIDHITVRILFLALAVVIGFVIVLKRFFIEPKTMSIKSNDVKAHSKGRQSVSLTSKTASVTPKLVLNEGIAAMADSEVVNMMNAGKLPIYALESRLGDPKRAAIVRKMFVSGKMSKDISNLPTEGYNYADIFGKNCENVIGYTNIPVGVVGPHLIDEAEYFVPMATTEGALIASTSRGCKAIFAAGGARTVITADAMTRAPVVRFPDIESAAKCKRWLEDDIGWSLMTDAFRESSRFAKLQSVYFAYNLFNGLDSSYNGW